MREWGLSGNLLDPRPNISADVALRCSQIQALAMPLDKRMLASFVAEFSWASSAIEGGAYSPLETQALIQYGQRNRNKPTADAVLVVNHMRAVEHLWAHRELTIENACKIHALLTDAHGFKDLEHTEHFLPRSARGVPRDAAEIDRVMASTTSARTEASHLSHALQRLLASANELGPIEAALYLLSRLPRLQPFPIGNKRTSRVLANAPLLRAGLAPCDFVGVDRPAYLGALAAHCESGSLSALEQAFVRAYVRSVIRYSIVPEHLRANGFNASAVFDDLLRFVLTGDMPTEERSSIFVRTTRAPTRVRRP